MDCSNFNPHDVAPLFILTFVAFVILIALIAAIIKTWIYCMVFHKAGYGWAWGLLILVPIANIIIPFVLALGDWPVRKELRLLKQQSMGSKT
jgi:MFS family permease